MPYSTITGTNPYCWTLTDPRGGIILNKCYSTGPVNSYLLFPYLYSPMHILPFCTSIFHICIFQYLQFQRPSKTSSSWSNESGDTAILLLKKKSKVHYRGHIKYLMISTHQWRRQLYGASRHAPFPQFSINQLTDCVHTGVVKIVAASGYLQSQNSIKIQLATDPTGRAYTVRSQTPTVPFNAHSGDAI